jgi:hypothetical protein
MPPPPHHLLVGTLVAVAAGLSVFVLAGGGDSLPATPHVPATAVAATRIQSAVAAPRPPSALAPRAQHARATARSVRAAPRLRPAAHPTVRRHQRRIVARRHVAPVAPATPVSAPPASAKPVFGKHGKERGRPPDRAKGRGAAKGDPKDKRSHKKTEPPRKKDGDHGNNGGGHGGHGDHGGKDHQGGK